MSLTVLYMSMSLDGFVTGPNPSLDNPLGDGGERLHKWFFPVATEKHHKAAAQQLRPGVNSDFYEEIMSTGAVIAGRGTFEGAGGWDGDHHDGVPIYILSRHAAPAWAANWPAVHYTSDLPRAVRDAKDAAGDKNVLVHGAGVIARRALTEGLLDEMGISLVPILMGDGQRLFEHLGVEQRALERIRILEGEGGVTHLRYRVLR
jgi:dihydrofolate reductase